ncbi:MAG TPA: hypothetical protein VGC55_09390 [Dokdonella sp.]
MSAHDGCDDVTLGAFSHERAPAVAVTGDGVDAYPRAISGWLIADLFLCAVNALLALVVLAKLGAGADADSVPVMAIETAVHAGIAVFGIPANIALLRRKPFGAVLAKIALAFVGAGMALALYEVSMRIDDPESTCPPELVVAGAALGLALRLVTNLIWFDRVRRAQKRLRCALSHDG